MAISQPASETSYGKFSKITPCHRGNSVRIISCAAS